MPVGSQYRLAQHYDSAYIGYRQTWRFLVEEVLNDNVTPVALNTEFDSVKLQVYANDTSSTMLVNVTASILSGAADLENGTQARCEVVWTPEDADFDAGDYIVQLVGVSSSVVEIIEKPWMFEVFEAGTPTT